MFFMPQDEKIRLRVKKMFETIVKKEGLIFLGWREVPTVPKVLGKKALDAMPFIVQAFVEKSSDVEAGLDFDRKLYQVRRIFEQSQFEDTYVCSLSSRTIVYKGMFLVQQLRLFFKDLQDKSYKSAIALVHSRFSTNTMPSWKSIQLKGMRITCSVEKKTCKQMLWILQKYILLLMSMVPIQLC